MASGKRQVSFALSAASDLGAIRDRYDAQQVPDVGERLLREVVSEVERLAEFPESGRIVPEFHVGHLREIIHPPFRIVYRLDEEKARVARVWRSERLLKVPDE